MIHNNQDFSEKSLSQLHIELLAIANWHSYNKISHQFFQYVSAALLEDLPCDSQAAILLDHLITSYLAENENFLDEMELLINRALENIREVES